MSRAEIMELIDEESVMRGELSSETKLCAQKGPSFIFGGEKPPATETREVGSRKKKLSSFMTSAMDTKRETSTSSVGGKQDQAERAEPIKMETETDEVEVTVMIEEVEAENSEEKELENTKDVETENGKKAEMVVKDKSFANGTRTGSWAAKQEAGPEVFLKSQIKKYCFSRDTLFHDLKEKYELQTASVLQ